MALSPGDVVYMDYGERPRVVHTRLVLAVVDHGTHEYVVLTPDKDIYPEVLHESNEDLAHFFLSGPHGGIPRGVSARNVYAFAPMAPAELALHMQAGRAVAEEEIRHRGRGPDPAAGVGIMPQGAVTAVEAATSDQEIWVLHDYVKGKKIGEEIVLPADAPKLGDRAMVGVKDSDGKDVTVLAAKIERGELAEFCEGRIAAYRAAEAIDGDDKQVGDDVRTMSVKYLANGDRGRPFKDSVKEFIQVEFDDWPLQPRTCQDYLNAVSEVAESCYMQHLAWVQQARIPEGDRSIYEDELLSRVIDTAIKYDCLNIVNLASFEMIVRRKQLLAEAHVGNPSAPSYEAADYFMGRRYRPGGGIVVPTLTEHVAKRMHEDAQVLKEKRKLSEAKGKGKGKTTTPPPHQEGGGGAKK